MKRWDGPRRVPRLVLVASSPLRLADPRMKLALSLCLSLSVMLPLQRIVFEEMDLVGVRANPGTCEEIIPLIAAGKVDVDVVTTHTFPLADFREGYETFTKRIDGALNDLIQPSAS